MCRQLMVMANDFNFAQASRALLLHEVVLQISSSLSYSRFAAAILLLIYISGYLVWQRMRAWLI